MTQPAPTPRCHLITYALVSVVVVGLLQWHFGHDPITASCSTHVLFGTDVGLWSVVALALDSLASFWLVDEAVVLFTLGAIVTVIVLLAVAMLTLFALHGQAFQALRGVYRSCRWLVLLLTVSM